MVIDTVHGLHATGVSLNDRFTMLASVAPVVRNTRPKRRASIGAVLQQNYNYQNRYLDQVARRLELQAKRQALRLRLGLNQRGGGLRRFGSESNLSLRRSNSFGNLSVKDRVQWRQSNGNLSQSSFNHLNTSWRARALRGFRRRGGGQRALRGRFRGQNGQQRGVGRLTRAQYQLRLQQRQARQGGAGRGARGAGPRGARGGARGGFARSQSQPLAKKMLSKEELDAQLDQYMACTKSALDQELDNYMKNAMDLE